MTERTAILRIHYEDRDLEALNVIRHKPGSATHEEFVKWAEGHVYSMMSRALKVWDNEDRANSGLCLECGAPVAACECDAEDA